MKIGLKLWSTNDYYLPSVQALLGKQLFDYIELFIVPGSFSQYISIWKNIPVPYILHAPHYSQGLNLSLQTSEYLNKRHCEEVQQYTKSLCPQNVIFHPGMQGTIDETVRQINLLKEFFPDVLKIALIENKPKIGLNDENCVGSSPMEIKHIMIDTNIGFCLDFGHASGYAAAVKIDYNEVLRDFLALSPMVFHLSDGRKESIYDGHLHLGSGNYDLKRVISFIPNNSDSCVTLETEKSSKETLDDFVEDVNFVKRHLHERN